MAHHVEPSAFGFGECQNEGGEKQKLQLLGSEEDGLCRIFGRRYRQLPPRPPLQRKWRLVFGLSSRTWAAKGVAEILFKDFKATQQDLV